MKIADDSNEPENYETLSVPDKAILQQWIQLTMQPTSRWHPETSLSLKHEFEEDTGISVSNGQFKGGMRAAGYEPSDRFTMNWAFKILPRCPHRKQVPSPHPSRRFALCTLTEQEQQHFAMLIKQREQG